MNKKAKSSRQRMMNRHKWGRGGVNNSNPVSASVATPNLFAAINAMVRNIFKRQKV